MDVSAHYAILKQQARRERAQQMWQHPHMHEVPHVGSCMQQQVVVSCLSMFKNGSVCAPNAHAWCMYRLLATAVTHSALVADWDPPHDHACACLHPLPLPPSTAAPPAPAANDQHHQRLHKVPGNPPPLSANLTPATCSPALCCSSGAPVSFQPPEHQPSLAAAAAPALTAVSCFVATAVMQATQRCLQAVYGRAPLLISSAYQHGAARPWAPWTSLLVSQLQQTEVSVLVLV
jgi:hypothetical protein